MMYVISASAVWNAGYEHPYGKRDINEIKEKSFSKQFNAENVNVARVMANNFLSEFKESLPERYDGSMFWNDEPEVNVTFGRVLKL